MPVESDQIQSLKHDIQSLRTYLLQVEEALKEHLRDIQDRISDLERRLVSKEIDIQELQTQRKG